MLARIFIGVGARPADRQRFESRILPYLNDLHRAALRLTGTISEAEDLVQETCLRAYQSLDQLRHEEAAKAWVFSILRSVFLRRAERAAAQPPLVSLEDLEASLLDRGEALRDLYEMYLPLGAALRAEVREAILTLPLPHREIIILAHIGGFSYREMARILEVPMGTVMSRLFRARRMLRTLLRETIQGRCRPETVR